MQIPRARMARPSRALEVHIYYLARVRFIFPRTDWYYSGSFLVGSRCNIRICKASLRTTYNNSNILTYCGLIVHILAE